MKSLLCKDFFVLMRYSRSVVGILAFLALIQVFSVGVEGFVAFAAIFCGILVISSFSYDESAKWMRYALVMPLRRQDIVAAKYVLLLLLACLGVLIGLVFGTALGLLFGKWVFSVANVEQLLLTGLVSVVATMVIVGTAIPLLFRFGAEKGRLWLFVSVLFPVGLIAGGYYLLGALGVPVTEGLIRTVIYVSPLFALVWTAVSYCISCKIVDKLNV